MRNKKLQLKCKLRTSEAREEKVADNYENKTFTDASFLFVGC